MSALFYVELLTHHGDVKARHAFDAFPITIGRGYDSDLILDDRYIAARHAIVEKSESGELTIADLDSRNGLLFQGKRVKRAVLDGNGIVRLGHTSLRIRSADFAVEPELTDTTVHGWEGWPPAITGIAIISLLSVMSVWLTDTEQFSAVRYLLALALVLSLVTLWCGCWAFANRVIGSHARFGRHIFIVASALLLMELWDTVSVTIAYAYSLEFLTHYGEHVMMAISAGMVFFHLVTINPEHPKRFATLSVVLLFLGSGLILLNNYQREGRLAGELYMSALLPPVLRQSADQPVSKFFNETAILKSKVDRDRLKPLTNDSLLPDAETDAEESQ